MSVQERIHERLAAAFAPVHLELENESHSHNVPPNSETHFRVVLVSDAFSGKRQVARHQAVYAALAEELAGPVHALALHTYDPAEWRAREGGSPASPACLGGSKADGRSR
ncbi:MAG: BolA family protein [Pseudohaliea sp.]